MNSLRAMATLGLVLLLAACGGSKNKTDKDTSGKGSGDGACSDTDTDSGRNKSGDGNGSRSNSSGNTAKGNTGNGGGAQPQPEPEPEPSIYDTPKASCDVEGKVTEFTHVMAFWDEVNHSVRVVCSTAPIPDNQLDRLRIGEPIEAETPHLLVSFILKEGTTECSYGAIENQVYGFHWLTSLSPMNLINLGKPAIKELAGKPKVGEKVKVQVVFRSEEHKDAPAEKVHFDLVYELELK